MGISRYLAMTAAEMEAFSLPENRLAAYMACHFSPYSTGLSNLPDALPPDCMLILNDRTPYHGHDPVRILGQLTEAMEQLRFSCLLLDLERPEVSEYSELCRTLTQALPCPVGVSAAYGAEPDCAVFLPPVPLDQDLEFYIAPWEGREIWLDVAPEAGQFLIDTHGSRYEPLSFSAPPENAFTEETLHCRYRAEIKEKEVCFRLWRDLPQVEALIERGNTLGIAKYIGLYQELVVQ